jgi:hypothetical protein
MPGVKSKSGGPRKGTGPKPKNHIPYHRNVTQNEKIKLDEFLLKLRKETPSQ